MARVFVGVGSSISPEENIREAIRLLRREVRVRAVSTFYRSEALDRPGDPPFCNGVVEVETDLPPAELRRAVLRRIESDLGRVRTEDRYAPRTIDLDILVYGDVVLTTDELVIPDPEIEQRAFLAVPLHELAPNLVLPGSERTIRQIAGRFADHRLEPLAAYSATLRRDVAHGL